MSDAAITAVTVSGFAESVKRRKTVVYHCIAISMEESKGAVN